jgi:hypothetical protein
LASPSQAGADRNRDYTWLESGSGAFHDTIACRTLLRLSLLDDWPNRSGVMLRRPGCCAGITAT